MQHPLEVAYGLTALELVDAVSKRFRARVALEGVVAEVHLGKHIRAAEEDGAIERFEEHDADGYPDYSIWLPGMSGALRVECKNVRDSEEAYRVKGEIVAFKVEVQKTRAAKGDPSSRYYGIDQFEILAVCLGKKTGNWRHFVFAFTDNLDRQPALPHKLAVMHRVPMDPDQADGIWFGSLPSLLKSRYP